ncbi:MAG: phage terminase large subunit [Veillonella parvula]
MLFRGLDDPLKVTSITVEVGALCRLWIEEAYEIMSEDGVQQTGRIYSWSVTRRHVSPGSAYV